MSESVQVLIRLPRAAKDVADLIALERGVSKSTLFRQALGFMQCVHEAGKRGDYVGTTPDREALRQIISGPL